MIHQFRFGWINQGFRHFTPQRNRLLCSGVHVLTVCASKGPAGFKLRINIAKGLGLKEKVLSRMLSRHPGDP